MRRSLARTLWTLVALAPAASAHAQQPIDSVYTREIRALTPTDPRWKFSTELVDYLPASATVPSPLKVLGYVPGTVGRLSHVADINRYFRALAAASPRVKVFSIGTSDEGREMLAVAIGDDSTIATLDEYRARLARLSDTRGLSPEERGRLIQQAKPVYWFTGTIHSPETGSPEMLMELAYRLAVDESAPIKAIRAGVITLITPVLEVDGRDRAVDAFAESRALKVGERGVPLVYWGKYTAHDNNRDAMVVSQRLTQAVLATFLAWHPTVAHDLHESVPFLYTSTGTGPYNDEYDPILTDELHTLAYQEITELTRRGLPGVWTHGFYDGWAPNYTVLSVASLHNSIGRFYETYTSLGAECHVVHLGTDAIERRWDRENPPVNGVRWCIRSNINYQESAALIALRYVADNRETFLDDYVAKVDRLIHRGRTSAPYAYVVPRDQRHAGEAAGLVNLFRTQGSEIHVATADFTATAAPRPIEVGSSLAPHDAGPAADESKADSTKHPAPETVSVHRGDWIIRMDQPYTATVRTLLAVQHFGANEPTPYDDTGWTLDLLRHVVTYPIGDSAVLTRPMAPMSGAATALGSITGDSAATPSRAAVTLVVRHSGDWRAAVLPWKVPGARVAVADTGFSVGGQQFPAGTFLVQEGTTDHRAALTALGLKGVATGQPLAVRRHAITLPRVALVHTWLETQNEGWVRFAFEQMGIPYTYVSDQLFARPGELDRFDVIVFPHVSASTATLINGRPMIGPPVPWRKTAQTPALGHWDETDDLRPGMGLSGAAALRQFVDRGGLLITEGATSELPVALGFNPTLQVVQPKALRVQGSVLRAQVVAKDSPIVYGYDDTPTFPVYQGGTPVLAVQPRDTLQIDVGVDSSVLRAAETDRAQVILRYHSRPDSLLLSGLLVSGNELAGKAAVIEAPVGTGHVVLFGIRPLWRWESQGTFALVVNAIANWNDLDARK